VAEKVKACAQEDMAARPKRMLHDDGIFVGAAELH
jgi:hypothetical protein